MIMIRDILKRTLNTNCLLLMLALHPLFPQEQSKNAAESVYFETITVYANKVDEEKNSQVAKRVS